MSTTAAPRRFVQHIRLKAPAARVYRALTHVDELVKWFPDRATLDARVGGAWQFEFDHGGGCSKASGTFLELVPNELVRYSWLGQLGEDAARLFNLTVTFRLEADGDETDLYLEETGYGEGSLYDGLLGERSAGWGRIFEWLEKHLAA